MKHIHGVSNILSVEDVSENDAKMECESQLSVQERKHTGVKHLIDNTCGTSSNDLKGRDKPQPIVNPFTCDACGKSFSLRINLRRHEQIHSGVKPFICDKCGQLFTRSSALKEHELIHTGVKPFMCDACGKSFTRSSLFELHKKMHTGVKPFTCETCQKSFTSPSGFRYHKRSHT